jgi:glycine cleavage system aminomethyltransferase T
VGKVVYTQMCNERGTIECDMTVGQASPKTAFFWWWDGLRPAGCLVDSKPYAGGWNG